MWPEQIQFILMKPIYQDHFFFFCVGEIRVQEWQQALILMANTSTSASNSKLISS